MTCIGKFYKNRIFILWYMGDSQGVLFYGLANWKLWHINLRLAIHEHKWICICNKLCDLNHSIFVSFVIVFILDWTPCHPSPSPPLPSSLFQLDPRPAAAASCDPCLATNPTTNPSSPPPFPPDRQAASPPLPLLPQPAGSFPTLAPRPRCTRPAAPTGAQLFFFPAA